MKIRWTSDSLRIRISPSELEALQRGDTVEARLGSGTLAAWSAVILPASQATALLLEPGVARLTLSHADGERLADPYAEGVYFQQDGEPPMRYYIEKDFPCAHPRAMEAKEPATETFPAPDGFETRKS